MRRLLLLVLCLSGIGLIAWMIVRRTNSYKVFRKKFRNDFSIGCRKTAELMKGISRRGPKGLRTIKTEVIA